MRKTCIVSLDIGGTNIRVGLVDGEYNLYNYNIINTSALCDGGDFLDGLCNFIGEYISAVGEGFAVLGVSAGFPSTVNKERTVLLSTPNIAGMDNVEVVRIMGEKLRLPIFINRDVNMLFYADLNERHISSRSIALGFYIGTGFGNSIYINGEILLGKNGVAGELGHIPILGKHDLCNCGNFGCAENYLSGKGLGILCADKFPETPINKVFACHSDAPEIDAFVEGITIPIATEVNIFDPDIIIIGGGIIQMEAFPRQSFESYIKKHSRKPFPCDNLQISYSAAKQENGVIGAGIHGFSRLKEA